MSVCKNYYDVITVITSKWKGDSQHSLLKKFEVDILKGKIVQKWKKKWV